MKAQHQSGSDAKATTTPDQQAVTPARRLMAIRIVGTALFDYQVQKTPVTRIRLECLTSMAQAQGDLTASDAAIVAQLLANPFHPGAQA
ncbi:hypothetical protein PSCICO_15250 [Pseudomonas cichorii]|uniref:hypothetical protein n=1 Tax=Pseudomonas cichorii TaxID=36746 RepID=UPI0019100423|nr:hypothetical protein [Pseudomonas cichorii]GFM86126.1 hypothetical protein PSCICO_15250 [Pseudomonas cichorii]